MEHMRVLPSRRGFGLFMVAIGCLYGGQVPGPGLIAAAQPEWICDFEAYVIDPDVRGLNVRAEPDGNAKIVLTLPKDAIGTTVHIAGCRGKWVRVDSASALNGELPEQVAGWIYASKLGMRTQTTAVRVRRQPKAGSQVVGRVPADSDVVLLGCREGWVLIQYGKLTGWVPVDDLCGNPVTTCAMAPADAGAMAQSN